MRHVIAFRHAPQEDPGGYGEAFAACGIALELVSLDAGAALPEPVDADAFVSLGGPMSPADDTDHPWMAPQVAFLAACIEAGVPVLGACLGAQLLARAVGGDVYEDGRGELGWFPVEVLPAALGDPVLGGLRGSPPLFQWHRWGIRLPRSVPAAARTERFPVQAFRAGPRAWAVQFHCEVDLTLFDRWAAAQPGDFAAFGVDLATLRAETEQRAGAQRRFVHDLVARFVHTCS